MARSGAIGILDTGRLKDQELVITGFMKLQILKSRKDYDHPIGGHVAAIVALGESRKKSILAFRVLGNEEGKNLGFLTCAILKGSELLDARG
jgi:hypothetical protein